MAVTVITPSSDSGLGVLIYHPDNAEAEAALLGNTLLNGGVVGVPHHCNEKGKRLWEVQLFQTGVPLAFPYTEKAGEKGS